MTLIVSQLKIEVLKQFEKENLLIVLPIYPKSDYMKTINSIVHNMGDISKKGKYAWFKLLVVNVGLGTDIESKFEAYISMLKACGVPIKYLKVNLNIAKSEILNLGVTQAKQLYAENILFVENVCEIIGLKLFLGKAYHSVKEKKIVGWINPDGEVKNAEVMRVTKNNISRPDFVFFKTDNAGIVINAISSLRKGNYPEPKNIEVNVFTQKPTEVIEPEIKEVIKRQPTSIDLPVPTEEWRILEKKILVGIVMSVYGRSKLTDSCLSSLKENTNVPYVLVVVDDGSSAATQKVLKKYKDDGTIAELILMKHAGKKGKVALNAGLKWLQENKWTDLTHIAILDNDFEISNSLWLRACVDGLEKSKQITKFKIGAVSVNPENSGHKTIISSDLEDFSLDIKEVIGGGQYLYSRDHFDEIENTMAYEARNNKDTDWALWKRHLAAGFHCAYITKAYSVFTFNWIFHAGVGQRSWGRKEIA